MIKIGISQARVLSCSIKIFLTAGSNNQAVADVLPATNRDKTKDIKEEDKTKTIQEIDREKLDKKFSKEDKEKLN